MEGVSPVGILWEMHGLHFWRCNTGSTPVIHLRMPHGWSRRPTKHGASPIQDMHCQDRGGRLGTTLHGGRRVGREERGRFPPQGSAQSEASGAGPAQGHARGTAAASGVRRLRACGVAGFGGAARPPARAPLAQRRVPGGAAGNYPRKPATPHTDRPRPLRPRQNTRRISRRRQASPRRFVRTSSTTYLFTQN
jgi:hypothetical protein